MAKQIKVKKDLEVSNEAPAITNEVIETPEPKVDIEIKEETKATQDAMTPLKGDVVTEEVSEEQRLLDYISNAHSERVELNPFLKSLYPLPTFQQPALWLDKGESKRIKMLLGKMQSENKISLVDDGYKKLGSFYYADGDTKTKHYNLDSVRIFALK